MNDGKFITDIYKQIGIDLPSKLENLTPSGLIIPNDQIFFINQTDNTKPLKIILENNSLPPRTEKYYLTLKEVLKQILNSDWKLRRTLTTQQIRSEKGKVRRGYCEEVINFLHKRGVSREYIESEVSTERERIIFSYPLNVSRDMINGNFGVYQIR